MIVPVVQATALRQLRSTLCVPNFSADSNDSGGGGRVGVVERNV